MGVRVVSITHTHLFPARIDDIMEVGYNIYIYGCIQHHHYVSDLYHPGEGSSYNSHA